MMSNSLARQRARLLKALQQDERITTLYARSELDICHPAGRAMELRKKGFNIVTHRRIDFTPEGNPHRVAEYILLPGKRKTPAGRPGQKHKQKDSPNTREVLDE